MSFQFSSMWYPSSTNSKHLPICTQLANIAVEHYQAKRGEDSSQGEREEGGKIPSLPPAYKKTLGTLHRPTVKKISLGGIML